MLQQKCNSSPRQQPCTHRGEVGMEHASAQGTDHHGAQNSVPEVRKHQHRGCAPLLWHCWDWGQAQGCTGRSHPMHNSGVSYCCTVTPLLHTSTSWAPAAELMQLTGRQFPANKTTWQQAPGKMGFFKSPAYTLLTRHPLPPYSI